MPKERVAAQRQPVLRPRQDRDHAACLVDVRLRMFVDKYQQSVIEDRAVAFRNRSELPDEIGELLQMPAVAFVILPAVAATLLTRFPAISKLMA